ncbi:MAG TPA: phosphopyruvate hydratase [Candidatus Methanomethylophilaceae archaeon]|nr:phosphopyruvate hydratase [Candidatus Methanomethylophilaceae archaeon]
MRIENVWGREVLYSRGNPTVEAEVWADGRCFTAIAPSGASTGSFEALELRDGDERFNGKGVLKAVHNIRERISPALKGMDVRDQRAIDQFMKDLDGTPNKASLGGNAVTAVSMAIAKAGAYAEGKEVYEYIGDDGLTLPLPMLNIINGGKHAGGELRIQEFMIIPAGAETFAECLRMSAEVYSSLKILLKNRYGVGAINIGDEGGFAPPLDNSFEAMATIVTAIEDAGYEPGEEVFLGIDAASSEFYKGGVYSIDGMELSAEELIEHYSQMVEEFPLVSIEDPFEEEDFESLVKITRILGDRVQIVGDDVFVTNTVRLQKGIDMGAANALLLKVNQIGTISEAEDAALMSKRNGYNVVVSHRSGESEDVTIADLAVGWGTGQIKTGAPARGERTAKYNRLLRIEEALGERALFPGLDAIFRW